MRLDLPPSGTRGVDMRGLSIFKKLNGLSVWMHRRTGGKANPRAGLLLTTIGAKSNKERTVGLGAFPDGDGRWLIVGSNMGAAAHPRWLHNLAEHPDKVWIEVGAERFKVHSEVLAGEERETAWARIVADSPGYGSYVDLTDRQIPVVRLTREP